MGLEAFKREEQSGTEDEENSIPKVTTIQTDLKGRLLADGSGEPNPQVSLKEYER